MAAPRGSGCAAGPGHRGIVAGRLSTRCPELDAGPPAPRVPLRAALRQPRAGPPLCRRPRSGPHRASRPAAALPAGVSVQLRVHAPWELAAERGLRPRMAAPVGCVPPGSANVRCAQWRRSLGAPLWEPRLRTWLTVTGRPSWSPGTSAVSCSRTSTGAASADCRGASGGPLAGVPGADEGRHTGGDRGSRGGEQREETQREGASLS